MAFAPIQSNHDQVTEDHAIGGARGRDLRTGHDVDRSRRRRAARSGCERTSKPRGVRRAPERPGNLVRGAAERRHLGDSRRSTAADTVPQSLLLGPERPEPDRTPGRAWSPGAGDVTGLRVERAILRLLQRSGSVSASRRELCCLPVPPIDGESRRRRPELEARHPVVDGRSIHPHAGPATDKPQRRLPGVWFRRLLVRRSRR